MHTTYLLKRYIVVTMLTVIFLAAITYGVEIFAGIELGSATAIVPVIIPALDAGQTYARRWEKRPENGYAWKLTAAFVVLNLCVGIVLMSALFAYLGAFGELTGLVFELATPVSAGIMVVVLIVYWVASRYFFGFGAKNYLKVTARQQSRSAS